jgi:hypothetical protein
MVNSYLIDSNILLRISRRVARALERLLQDDAALYYTHQNIAEFWNVWPRPVHNNGFGLAGEIAAQEIMKFESMMEFAPTGDRAGLGGHRRPGPRRASRCSHADTRHPKPAHAARG